MSEPRTALVVGGTGLVGRELVSRLLDHETWGKVVSLVRGPGGIAHRQLDERRVDFEQLATGAVALPAADDAFCCLGTTIKTAGSQAAFRRVDYDYVLAFARAARQAGADRLCLVSAIGADPMARTFYTRVKGEAEVAVQSVGFEAVHLFRPSLLTGSRRESRPFEKLGIAVARLVDPVMALKPFEPYRAIPAGRVAAAMVGAATGDAEGVHIHTFEGMARLAAD